MRSLAILSAAGFGVFLAVIILLVIEHRLGRIQKLLEKMTTPPA